MADARIAALDTKITPIDADVIAVVDSTGPTTKKLTWANIKATLKTYFDTLYSTAVKATGTEINTGTDDAKFATAKAIKDSHNVPSVAPGTDGNILTSDGTDWVSEAAAGGGTTFEKTSTAAEALAGATTPVPVCLAKKSAETATAEIEQNESSSDFSISNTTTWYGQSFTATDDMITVTSVFLTFRSFETPVGTWNVKIFLASGGKPTGSALASMSESAVETDTGFTSREFEFDTSLNVTSGLQYVVVFYFSSLSGGVYLMKFKSPSVYSGGTRVSSSNSGGTWTITSTYDMEFQVWGIEPVDPLTYIAWKCDADDSSLYGFVGFVATTVSTDDSCDIVTGGILAGFTSLIVGKDYYVQDTAGTIGTSVGSETIRVGRAISNTELIILV